MCRLHPWRRCCAARCSHKRTADQMAKGLSREIAEQRVTGQDARGCRCRLCDGWLVLLRSLGLRRARALRERLARTFFVNGVDNALRWLAGTHQSPQVLQRGGAIDLRGGGSLQQSLPPPLHIAMAFQRVLQCVRHGKSPSSRTEINAPGQSSFHDLYCRASGSSPPRVAALLCFDSWLLGVRAQRGRPNLVFLLGVGPSGVLG